MDFHVDDWMSLIKNDITHELWIYSVFFVVVVLCSFFSNISKSL